MDAEGAASVVGQREGARRVNARGSVSEPRHMEVSKPAPHFGVRRRSNAIQFSPLYVVAKRATDIIGALLLGVVFAPAMAYITLRLMSPRAAVIFSHQRIGRHGQPIRIYKFRTMVPDAERVLQDLLKSDPDLRREWAQDFKLKDDPRITPMGRFLRRTSLDELPQLWNVLKGDMSLVGPRPVVEEEIEKYGRIAHYYYAVKPGLTGLWQVTGRNDIDYRRRVALDRKYTENASFWMDFRILLKTVVVVLGRTGAY